MDTLPHFSAIFTKEINFCDFLFAFLDNIDSVKGSTFKRKNLLLEEQILLFQSGPSWKLGMKLRMANLLPMKVYPFT